MNVTEQYTYSINWSAEDKEWVGTVAEFPSLAWLDADRNKAIAGIKDLTVAAVEDIIADGEQPPAPLYRD